MQIGEAARIAGLEPSAIRFYEDQGILPGPDRTSSGYRNYSDEDVELLKFVRRLRSLELPLNDVQQIVDLWAEGKAPCAVVRKSISREAKAIDKRIEELRRLRAELTRLNHEAQSIEDSWPRQCVCHAVEPSLAE